MKRSNAGWIYGLVMSGMLLQLAACGGQAGSDGASVGPTGDVQTVQESTETAASGAQAPADSDAKLRTEEMVGEWQMVYSISHSEYEDGEPYTSVTMCEDPYSPSSELKIHQDGDKLIADYRYTYEMGSDRFYGNELLYRDEAAYEDCENQDWCYAFSMAFEEDEEQLLTLTDADTLVRYEVWESDPAGQGSEDYYYYKNETKSVYLRKDSPRLANPEELRYFDTVTVSSAEDLIKNIHNNTKIVLEAGTYDLTPDAFAETLSSPYVQREYGELCITASNLRIEAKEGAEVLVCVRDPYEAVLYFANSQNVVLHGLTVGHDVEPGYCSGSVLRYSSVSGVTIENCKLYGCGTYGVDAEYCYNMQVNDTEIYECTYGLLSLNSVSDAVFKNCEMRDSGDLTVFYLPSCYGIVFEDCDIHDNRSTENYNGQFVELDTEYGDVTFRKCRFNNNTYRKFSDYSVTLDQCTVKDNVK